MTLDLVFLLGFILIVIVLEIRDYKWSRKFKFIIQQNNILKRRLDINSECLKSLDKINEIFTKLSDLKILTEKNIELSDAAKTNLDIIINEYEINGIWLGKDRLSSKGIHAIEG